MGSSPGKVDIRQALVDHHHTALRGVLFILEIPAGDEARGQRLEVGSANHPLVHFIVLAVVGPADEADPHGVAVVRDRQLRREAHACHSGQRLEPPVQLARHRHDLRIRLVACDRHRHVHGREAARVEPDVHFEQSIEALASSPAPTSSTTATASSTTTRFAAERRQTVPDWVREPAARPPCISPSCARSTGARPKRSAAAAATAAMNQRTWLFSARSRRKGMFAAMVAGMRLRSRRIAPAARPTPSSVPPMTSTEPSARNWRTSRPRSAPSARRTAISRVRLSERTRSRLATFTPRDEEQQRRPTEEQEQHRDGRSRRSFRSGSTRLAPWPRFESGYCCSSCRSRSQFIPVSAVCIEHAVLGGAATP